MGLNEKNSICTLCAHIPICKHQPQQSCSYFQSKIEKKNELSSKNTASDKPKKSRWRKILRGVIICFILSVFFIGVIVAFIAGRYSTHPRLVSMVPEISKPVEAGLSPEDVIYKFYRYSRLHEVDNLTQLIHPELIEQSNYQLTSWINYAPGSLADLKEIKILSIQTEESATATISLVIKERNESGHITLRKHDGEWRILNFTKYY